MKKTALFFALSTMLLVAGCSTPSAPTPSTPKQKPGKYALQIIRIEAPVPEEKASKTFSIKNTDQLFSAKNPATDRTLGFRIGGDSMVGIEELLNTPKAVVIEFPIVYAAVGETAIEDQTETISAPRSYEPITDTNGVISIVYSDETAKIGRYVEMTLKDVENDSASCDLWFYEKSLAGMQKYAVAPATDTQDAVTASLPIFKKFEVKTEVTLAPGTWIGMGGLISEKIENFSPGEKNKPQITRIKKFSFIRILPPSTDK